MSNYKTINKKYSIEEYDPTWVEKFDAIKKILQIIFGENALAIEHVGSTSIAGMKAKPIIDVLVVVKAMEPFEIEKQKMQELGYQYQKNYLRENSLFFYQNIDGIRIENIHVFPVGHEKISEFIDTRDYLKTHPDSVRRYEELKERLYKEYPNDYISYRKGKDEFLSIELAQEVKRWKEDSAHKEV